MNGLLGSYFVLNRLTLLRNLLNSHPMTIRQMVLLQRKWNSFSQKLKKLLKLVFFGKELPECSRLSNTINEMLMSLTLSCSTIVRDLGMLVMSSLFCLYRIFHMLVLWVTRSCICGLYLSCIQESDYDVEGSRNR